MIIKARHHWFYYPFFKGYARLMTGLDFRKVTYRWEGIEPGSANVPVGEGPGTQLPVFMIGNHFSWWDGFIALNINQHFFRKKFHIMMLEEQLRDRMFLNKSGAFGLDKGRRSMVETFRYTAELLQDPQNLVVMYPQGKICSVYDRPLEFERGWFRIIEQLEHPVQVVYYHALVDYFNHRKPQMNIFVYKVDHTGKTVQQMEDEFNRLMEASLGKHRATL